MAKRFHDEFFRKTTPDHDELVVYCLSEEFQNQLIEILKINNYIKQYKFVRDSRVWECEKCSIEGFTEDEKCNLTWCWIEKRDYEYINDLFVKNSFFCYHNEKSCENFNAEHYKSFVNITAKGKMVSGIVQTDTFNVSINDKETEKICRSGNFIIGYIDVFYDINANYQSRFLGSHSDSKRKKTQNHVWDNFEEKKENLGIVVEVKPRINSWGGFLRQIKTYMDTTLGEEDFYDAIIGVLVTYDQLSPKEVEILKSENVLYFSVSKKDIKDGLDRFLEKE